jgi:hypothetical protein
LTISCTLWNSCACPAAIAVNDARPRHHHPLIRQK